MTPKRHAIAKEIIKLLYPGPPFVQGACVLLQERQL